MCKNAKHERMFGATPADFFENHTAYLLQWKECSEMFEFFLYY